MSPLPNKKILVTGASGGIGSAIVKNFHDAGADVAVSGSNEEKLKAFAASFGARVHPHVCNFSDLSSIEPFAAEVEKTLGGLDVLVCNAGITRDTLAMRMKDEDWQSVIDINLTATFKLIRSFLKGMMKQRSGRIIIVTSIVGHSGNPGQANYCAAKAGLTGMAKALAHETASRGITVNCIAPGFIATPMTDALTDEQKSRITQNIPMNRMGTPEDIAAAAMYLASENAAYVTGQTLHVNGGLYM